MMVIAWFRRRIRHGLCSACFIIVSCGLSLTPAYLSAKDLKASIAFIPTLAESPTKGAFVDLVKAIDGVYEEGRIEINVYPFARSIRNVITGQADFHLPMMRTQHYSSQSHPFRLMDRPMGQVCLILYSHRDVRLTPQELYRRREGHPYPYQLRIMRGSAQFLDLPIQEVSQVRQGLQMVALKRIDGFIGAQEEGDYVLREMDLKDVYRTRFNCYDDVIILPKTPEGRETELILEHAMDELDRQGRLKKLHGKIHRPYRRWQIYDQPVTWDSAPD